MVVSVLFHSLSEHIFIIIPCCRPSDKSTGRFAKYRQNKESAKNRWSRCFSPLHLFFDIQIPSPAGISTKKVWKIAGDEG